MRLSYYLIKITITVVLVVIISEVAKRSTFMGGLLASIPLISVLAIFWLYIESRDVDRVSSLATSIFWLVIPSLALFISLPVLLMMGFGFYASLVASILITIAAYYLMISIHNQFGITL